MPFVGTVDVLVVMPDEVMERELMRIANEQHWAVLASASPRHTLRQVRAAQPRAVVVQVSNPIQPALRLISLLTSGWWKLPVFAVASKHDPVTERAVRSAGASCYLPNADRSLPEAVKSLSPKSAARNVQEQSRVTTR